jgi:hypothetical protein
MHSPRVLGPYCQKNPLCRKFGWYRKIGCRNKDVVQLKPWWCARCGRYHISTTLYELKGLAFSNSRKPPKRRVVSVVSDKMQGSWRSNCSAPQELSFLYPGDRREGVWLDVRSSMSKKFWTRANWCRRYTCVRHLNALISRACDRFPLATSRRSY